MSSVIMKYLCVLLYLFSNLCSLQGFICPGGQQKCKLGMTCCELPNGSQGCCPYRDATCCRDKIHCCPYGLQCHKNGCGRSEGITYVPLTQIGIVENVICPDNKQCPDGQTCCSISLDSYGCCPMLDAVCCADKKHCCPPETYCDAQGYCYRTQESSKNYSSSIVCPGDKYICPLGNTCCSLSDDVWGCCPLSNAVCCSDGLHCCPEGYTCTNSGCLQDTKQIPVSKFIKLRKAL